VAERARLDVAAMAGAVEILVATLGELDQRDFGMA
jgi:hypothetical protein